MNEREALEAIIAAAGQQLDLIEEAAIRPEIDKAQLSKSALDLVLAAMASHVQGLDGEAFAAFAARVAQIKAEQIDVRHHLIELSESWVCRACKSDVASGAVIAGVKARKPKVSLACKACGATTPLAPLGVAAFKKRFGQLVKPTWNPEHNGFIWNER